MRKQIRREDKNDINTAKPTQMNEFKIRQSKPHERTNMREKISEALLSMNIHDAMDVSSRAELNTALRVASQIGVRLRSRKQTRGGWTLIRIG